MKTSPYRREKPALNAQMNVVPYIDVMLVLLVIFMVTTPMLTTGVDVDLPKEKTNTLSTSNQLPVIVSLKDNGEIYISYESNVDMPVSESELIDTLSRLQAKSQEQGEESVQVMINADQNNQYGSIMQLMANLQQAGIKKVGLLTGKPLPESGQ